VDPDFFRQNPMVSWNDMLQNVTMRRKEKLDASIIRKAAMGIVLPMSKKREKKMIDK
jgi:hypothetical protein